MKKSEDKSIKRSILVVVIFILLVLSLGLNVFLFVNKNVEYKNDENIIFFGDSITSGYSLSKFYPKKNVINKGISGNQTVDLINRINTDVYEYNPSKVFLLIGVNDMAVGNQNADILSNIQQIINGIKINREAAEIYVESIYPVNKEMIISHDTTFALGIENANIIKLNSELEKLCKENDVTYIDVYDKIVDENNNLRQNYTYDGIHLTDYGYLKITSILKEYLD